MIDAINFMAYWCGFIMICICLPSFVFLTSYFIIELCMSKYVTLKELMPTFFRLLREARENPEKVKEDRAKMAELQKKS